MNSVALTIARGVLTNPDPRVGRVVVPYTADFTNASDLVFDFSALENNKQWTPCRGIYVNNSKGLSAITCTVSQTGEQLVFPPGAAMLQPCAAQPGSTIELSTAGGVQPGNASNIVSMVFYNYDVAPFVATGFQPFTSGSTVVLEGRDGQHAMSDTNPVVTEKMGAAPISVPTALVANTMATPVAAGANYLNVRLRNIGDAAGNQIPAYYNVGGNANGTFANGDHLLPADGVWQELPYRINSKLTLFAAASTQIEIETW